MAKKLSGEVSITLGGKNKTLRLDVGTMMDLEDHFDMGFLPFIERRLPEMRTRDMATLVVAMTGSDFTDDKLIKKAAKDILCFGIAGTIDALKTAIVATLMPETTKPKKPGK